MSRASDRLQLGMAGPSQVAVATLVGSLFALYSIALWIASPPNDAQWQAADPILGILPQTLTLGLIPLLAISLSAAWSRFLTPASLRAGAEQALLGGLLAVAFLALLSVVTHGRMPSFIPPEEGAGPGFTLSMAAGLGEELLFRLGLVSLLYLIVKPRMKRHYAIVVCALAAGLSFALLHEVGQASFERQHFATRALVPGAGMTMAYFLIGPSFLVAAHCAAHVAFPAFFA